MVVFSNCRGRFCLTLLYDAKMFPGDWKGGDKNRPR